MQVWKPSGGAFQNPLPPPFGEFTLYPVGLDSQLMLRRGEYSENEAKLEEPEQRNRGKENGSNLLNLGSNLT